MTRIAVVDNEKLRDMDVKKHIMNICPVNRTGNECITISNTGKLIIDENLCTGCGICPKAAPHAISIVNLPEELAAKPIHRYGQNGFALYHLPIPIANKVVGIIGRNGMGKSTAIKILAGTLQPNLGNLDKTATYKELVDHFKGTEAQKYFEQVRDNEITVAYKPQQVDLIPQQSTGTVRSLLEKTDEKKSLVKIAERLGITNILDSDIKKISGGELQRVAIAATVLKKANVYFFDEPTAYLDIKQRLNVALFIRELAAEDVAVMVIEHDLIILDYMTDQLHLMYGQEGTYGVVSGTKSTKNGINIYLDGFLKEENIRFRQQEIKFDVRPPTTTKKGETLTTWEDNQQSLGRFTLQVHKGNIARHATIGVVGENGIGKTTFVKLLKDLDKKLEVSYKPQYLETNDELVMSFLHDAISSFKTQLIGPLGLEALFMRKCSELSGGELQRVMVAKCLSAKADLYLLDEPSAYLDVEQRLAVSKVIRDLMYNTGKSALVVDHDILFVDYLSDSLMVFEGEPAVNGHAYGPFPMEEGMNRFLQDLQLSFRRDEHSHCPRTNKPGSQLDRKQKNEGKLYYG